MRFQRTSQVLKKLLNSCSNRKQSTATVKGFEAAEMNKKILEECKKNRKLELELQNMSTSEARSVAYCSRKKRKNGFHCSTNSKSSTDEGSDTDII